MIEQLNTAQHEKFSEHRTVKLQRKSNLKTKDMLKTYKTARVKWHSVQFSSVQSLSHVQLFSTPCGSPGSSVLGISLARILKWVAIFLSSGSSQPRD